MCAVKDDFSRSVLVTVRLNAETRRALRIRRAGDFVESWVLNVLSFTVDQPVLRRLRVLSFESGVLVTGNCVRKRRGAFSD